MFQFRQLHPIKFQKSSIQPIRPIDPSELTKLYTHAAHMRSFVWTYRKMPLIKRQCFGKKKNWNTKKITPRHSLLSPFIHNPTWKSTRSSEASTSPSYGRSRCQRSLDKWSLKWGHYWAIVVHHNPRSSSTFERRAGFTPYVE